MLLNFNPILVVQLAQILETHTAINPFMDGGFLPAAFLKWAILLAIVEPHGNQTSHKAKGAYLG